MKLSQKLIVVLAIASLLHFVPKKTYATGCDVFDPENTSAISKLIQSLEKQSKPSDARARLNSENAYGIPIAESILEEIRSHRRLIHTGNHDVAVNTGHEARALSGVMHALEQIGIY